MESWYAIVIGTVMFLYVHSFNRVTKMYIESGKTLSFRDFFTTIIPIADTSILTH